MNFDPKSAVAIILALSVMVFFVGGVWMEIASIDQPPNPETTALWRDVIMVLIGSLAGYIAGNSNNTK